MTQGPFSQSAKKTPPFGWRKDETEAELGRVCPRTFRFEARGPTLPNLESQDHWLIKVYSEVRLDLKTHHFMSNVRENNLILRVDMGR
jgi:hypothetical protein